MIDFTVSIESFAVSINFLPKMQLSKWLLLVFGLSCLLVFGVFMDIFYFAKRVTRTSSVLKLVTPENGEYEDSLFMLTVGSSAFFHKPGENFTSYSPSDFCSCSKKPKRWSNQSQPCNSKTAALLHAAYTEYFWFIEAPKKFMTEEIIKISCKTNVSIYYNYMHFPLSLENLDQMVAKKTANAYLHKIFYDRAIFVLSKGYYVLITMTERQFADDNKQILPKNRYINSQSTLTSTGCSSRTEIELVWGRLMIVKISNRNNGNYLSMVKIMATFFLSAERVFTTYNRFKVVT